MPAPIPSTHDVVYVPVSRPLIEEMNGRWSEQPVFVKVIVNEDGTGEMLFQRPAPPREA